MALNKATSFKIRTELLPPSVDNRILLNDKLLGRVKCDDLNNMMGAFGLNLEPNMTNEQKIVELYEKLRKKKMQLKDEELQREMVQLRLAVRPPPAQVQRTLTSTRRG